VRSVPTSSRPQVGFGLINGGGRALRLGDPAFEAPFAQLVCREWGHRRGAQPKAPLQRQLATATMKSLRSLVDLDLRSAGGDRRFGLLRHQRHQSLRGGARRMRVLPRDQQAVTDDVRRPVRGLREGGP
jgi:hypothetical protein